MIGPFGVEISKAFGAPTTRSMGRLLSRDLPSPSALPKLSSKQIKAGQTPTRSQSLHSSVQAAEKTLAGKKARPFPEGNRLGQPTRQGLYAR
jgi:hypothetical protein